MRILIIGGGVFVGRTLIDAALAAGHDVTAFSRGKSPLPHPDRIRVITGDRDNPADLAPLGTTAWDAVIDTCAYRPRQVDQLLAAIGPRAHHYTLVSSVSAYADLAAPDLPENAPLAASLPDPGASITPQNYGPLKADCERAAAAFPRTFVVRPGIIAGPHDPTDRFTYWVDLIARQSRIVVPADLPAAAVQLIDARDLAAWIIHRIEVGTTGAFNAVGPADPITMATLLDTIAAALGRSLALETRTLAELAALGLAIDQAFPLRLPADHAYAGLFRVDGRRAHAAGLALRPLAATARDTAAWFSTCADRPPKVGWPAAAMRAALFKTKIESPTDLT